MEREGEHDRAQQHAPDPAAEQEAAQAGREAVPRSGGRRWEESEPRHAVKKPRGAASGMVQEKADGGWL
jgi:hypothetical protein